MKNSVMLTITSLLLLLFLTFHLAGDRVRVGAGRARKPHYGGALLRRLAIRNAGAFRTAIGVHHHIRLVALFIGRSLHPHEWEGRRRHQQARQHQRTSLFRLDTAGDWRARALLRHPRGARTVEPAMAPPPIAQLFSLLPLRVICVVADKSDIDDQTR